MRKDTPHAVGSDSSAPAAPAADDPYPGPQVQSIDDEGWTQRYTPYGEQRSEAQVETDYRYTGQREEDAIGLYYYDARWYDPALGRFIQPDTIVPGASNTQALNRYSYVLNNPMKYTDPTGRLHDPSADADSSKGYSYYNLSSHPAYRGQWFAENKRFTWATEFNYQEHLWIGERGYYSDVQTLSDYREVRTLMRGEPRYGDLSRYIGQSGGGNSWWHSTLGWALIFLGNNMSPLGKVTSALSTKYPDNMDISYTDMIPPGTGGWTLGDTVGLSGDAYFTKDYPN